MKTISNLSLKLRLFISATYIIWPYLPNYPPYLQLFPNWRLFSIWGIWINNHIYPIPDQT